MSPGRCRAHFGPARNRALQSWASHVLRDREDGSISRSSRRRRPSSAWNAARCSLSLRFFAFLAVFVHHSVPEDPVLFQAVGMPPGARALFAAAVRSGAFGVDLFFVLSAALITELLLREQEQRGRLDVKAFLIRRALRIWPLYFAFLFGALVLDPRLLGTQGMRSEHVFGFLFFLGNWVCAFRGLPASFAAPLWSVSVEEQFYLVWPVLLVVFGRRRIPLMAGIAFAIAVASRLLVWAVDAPYPAMWCMTLTRLDPIAAGMLIAVALRRRPIILATWRRAVLVLGGLACWIGVELFASVEWHSAVTAVAAYPLITLGAALILVGFHSWPSPLVQGPILVYLGRISYGLYVFHGVGIWLGQTGATALQLPLPTVTALPLAMASTVALATLSYRYLESPFLRLKQRFTYVSSRGV